MIPASSGRLRANYLPPGIPQSGLTDCGFALLVRQAFPGPWKLCGINPDPFAPSSSATTNVGQGLVSALSRENKLLYGSFRPSLLIAQSGEQIQVSRSVMGAPRRPLHQLYRDNSIAGA